MSIASSSINLFPWLYGKVRWTGALNSGIARWIFVKLYFAYKWVLEDSLAAFLKRNPQLIEHGHILDIGANIGSLVVPINEREVDWAVRPCFGCFQARRANNF